ncbi:MAG: putative MFS family arabinose efflux permease [Acidimicrobiales bacterium]|jgi:hypothetical protein
MKNDVGQRRARLLSDYAVVTGAYWAFTITDGALRMLVLLHFHRLGYSPVALGFFFLLYEFLGVITNLVGGRMGARFGLNRTLYAGLATQVVALLLLSLQDPSWVEVVSVGYVMGTQALSGVAKDLTKMSSKSALKLVVPSGSQGGESTLFRWVAILTGSKNALKGVGFFVGGALLAAVGFSASLRLMAGLLALVLVVVLLLFRADIGRTNRAGQLGRWRSASAAINRLAAARVFLFGSRDLWFVVALPVYLAEVVGWKFEAIGAFLAAWVIGYGLVQSLAPSLLVALAGDEPTAAKRAAGLLAAVTAALALVLSFDLASSTEAVIIIGLALFGIVFAVNSAVHSYLILAYAERDSVATDVGFYYSANALGRLIGTLLSGAVYLLGGIAATLWVATGFVVVTWIISLGLPPVLSSPSSPTSDRIVIPPAR